MSSAPPPSPALPPEVAEEEGHLARTRTLLAENPENPGASEDEVVREIVKLQEEHRQAHPDDQAGLAMQIEHQMARLDQVRRGRKQGSVDPESPYFAHLRLQEKGRQTDIFLGRTARLGDGLRIVDWRNAPISRIFYQYDEGDEFCEEMGNQTREGTVAARRTVHIGQGQLRRVATRQQAWLKEQGEWRALERHALSGGAGQALRAGRAGQTQLGSGAQHRADKHLPDIAALIDPDQFQLISAPDSGVVVLRGSAGSGKTTVALHRIAWLQYNHPRRFQSDNVLVIVWGRAMRDYVAHVLPALGVQGVQVTTWPKWSRAQVLRHLPMLPTARAEDTPEPVTRLKLHPGVAELLARHVRSHKGPRTAAQVVEDWARTISDRAGLTAAVSQDLSPGALERALKWTAEQTSHIAAWMEGERSAEARLDAEDEALLLRAWQLRMGPLQKGGHKPIQLAHLVLDEVQDFSPVEVQVLLDCCDKERCVTMAGDVRQHISQTGGFSSWQEFLSRIGVESTALSTLTISYRSTHPITAFALSVLGDQDEPAPRTSKDGPPVELFRFSEHGAAVSFLAEELKGLVRREPLANIALITPDPGLSRLYAEGLEHAGSLEVRLVRDQEFAFAPGIDVVEADQVKGLEFDYVVVVEPSAAWYPDTAWHRRLLHVACTRAIHQLWLSCVGTPSPLLPEVDR